MVKKTLGDIWSEKAENENPVLALTVFVICLLAILAFTAFMPV